MSNRSSRNKSKGNKRKGNKGGRGGNGGNSGNGGRGPSPLEPDEEPAKIDPKKKAEEKKTLWIETFIRWWWSVPVTGLAVNYLSSLEWAPRLIAVSLAGGAAVHGYVRMRGWLRYAVVFVALTAGFFVLPFAQNKSVENKAVEIQKGQGKSLDERFPNGYWFLGVNRKEVRPLIGTDRRLLELDWHNWSITSTDTFVELRMQNFTFGKSRYKNVGIKLPAVPGERQTHLTPRGTRKTRLARSEDYRIGLFC